MRQLSKSGRPLIWRNSISKRTVLRSPIDGVIVKRDVNPGQTIAVALEAKTLFEIANNLDSMEVHGKIDEADIGKLKARQSRKFRSRRLPGPDVHRKRSFQIRKASEGWSERRDVYRRHMAPNPELLLLPGITAELRVVVSDTGSVLKIPNQALRFRPEVTDVAFERQAQRQSAPNAATLAMVWIVGTNGHPTSNCGARRAGRRQWYELLDGPLTEGQSLMVGVGTSQPRASF